jgi:predicted ATPase
MASRPARPDFTRLVSAAACLTSVYAKAAKSGARTCLVAGSAGAGKSTLIQSFIARIQAADDNAVVAVGACNPHTGAGDPYLPFLDVLTQLTGNVDAKLAQGSPTRRRTGSGKRGTSPSTSSSSTRPT